MFLKKTISCFLSLSFLLLSFIPAFAEGNQNIIHPDQSGESDIKANIEASNFDITVPLELPLYLHSDGSVSVATDAKIENNSQGPIIVNNVKLTPIDNWKLASFTDDYKTKKVNSKELGFQIMNENVLADGSVDMQAEDWPSIPGNDNLPLNYDGRVPVRSSDSTMITANLEFTLDWDKVNRVHQNILRYSYKGIDYDLNENGTASVSDRNDVSGDVVISDTVIDDNGLSYSVTSVGYEAFNNCNDLISVTIPDSVTSIGNYAFDGCDALTSVDMGNSVVSIGDEVFENCDALTNITIPDSVTSIGVYAFSDCDALTNVTIPNSLTSIDRGTFDDCDALISVTIPDSVTYIGAYAFDGCYDLTSADIGNSVTSVDIGAFKDCTSLTSVDMGNSVTSIGDKVFENCDALTNITIPDSVTYIGDFAFNSCSSLTSITIPSLVTYIGVGNFVHCNALINIDVNQNNQNYSSENGILFNKNKTELIQYPAGKTDNTYIIPSSVISIGNCAFEDCNTLTDVTISDSVTSIGEYAFENCTSLTNMTIPDSVTSIDNFAFENCSSLTSVIIPDSITSINEGIFESCDSLTSVTIPNTVTSIGAYSFEDSNALRNITIPSSVISVDNDVFRNWNSYQTINIEGKSSFQDTIDAGWRRSWIFDCYAQINYLGNTQTSTSITTSPSSNYSLSSLTDISGNIVSNKKIKISSNQNINYTVHFTEI